jgi:hypothetical protein
MSLLERDVPVIRSIYLKEYINHNHIDFQNCLDLIKDVNSWKSRDDYQQDLMFYGILDTTATATNDVILKHISAINDIFIPSLVPPASNKDELPVNIDFSKLDESSSLQSFNDVEHQILEIRKLMELKLLQVL